jgi:hypothetical protein
MTTLLGLKAVGTQGEVALFDFSTRPALVPQFNTSEGCVLAHRKPMLWCPALGLRDKYLPRWVVVISKASESCPPPRVERTGPVV